MRFADSFRRLFANPACDRALSALASRTDSFYRVMPHNEHYPPNSLRRARRHGIDWELDLSDWPDWCLYFHSNADSPLGVLSYVVEGDVVIDVGGNIGQTALPLALALGDDGRVISFEPFPDTRRRFCRNLELNPDLGVTVEPLALGNAPGIAKMVRRCRTNSGANQIADEGQQVRVVTLDEYASEMDRVDLIKVDVEGYELKVLEGAAGLLDKHRPRLYIELDDAALVRHGASAHQLLNFIASKGYRITDAATGGQVNPERHSDIYCRV
jgi:FkbM family methyltransferase